MRRPFFLCCLWMGFGQVLGEPLPPGGFHLATSQSYTNAYDMMFYCSNSEGPSLPTRLTIYLGEDSLSLGESLTARIFDCAGVLAFSTTFTITNPVAPPRYLSSGVLPQRFPSSGFMVLSMDNGSLDVTAIYLSSQQDFYCGYAISLEPELPSGFEKAPIANGLRSPTAMAFAPDGRLFVCEQGGSVRVIQNGLLLSANFLTLALDSTGERGLLGLAFDPDFAANQFLYVYYTATAPAIHHRISRFTACGDVAVPGSELVLIELDNLSTSTENNGGMIHFGPDGKLYAAVGDNGNPANAQTLTNLLGKILRLNSDGSVPPDNPFYHTASGVNRAIWALGLRNPYTFAFDPGTARMFINDKWEEINEGVAGANYGWTGCPDWFPCHQPGSRDPIFNYPHQNAWTLNGCASTAGTFYRPAMPLFPAEYSGLYFFADACLGWIRALNPTNYSVTPFATGLSHPVDMKVGPDGRLYYLTGGTTGSVWAIEPMGPLLHPSKTADRLVLTWRTRSAAGFFLQAAANLPPNTWATVTNEVRFDNGTNAVALPATNAAQFYRLIRQ